MKRRLDILPPRRSHFRERFHDLTFMHRCMKKNNIDDKKMASIAKQKPLANWQWNFILERMQLPFEHHITNNVHSW
jgi:hypothetical protein